LNGPWILDMGGLPSNPILGNIALDTLENVWLICNNQLYMQPLVSSTWTLKNNLTGFYRVYVDRFQKIWLGRVGQVVFTTDQGTTIQTGPSGIGSSEAIVDLSSDRNGDIYVLTWTGYFGKPGGNKIYRSSGGTAPFVRIDQGLAPQFIQGGNAQIYTSILADSGLLVSHQGGMHYTKDNGTTWQYIPGPPSPQAYGVVATHDDSLMMSTTAGAFKGTQGAWTKKHPVEGFQSGIRLFRDNSGIIYAVAEKVPTNNLGGDPRYVVYRSTNNGNSFTPDSAGLGAQDVGMRTYYVDENGTQHAGGSKYTPGFGNLLYAWKKEPGQPWVADNNGLPVVYNQTPWSLTGNGQGSLNYSVLLADGPRNYTRTAAQTSWTLVPSLNNQQVQDQAGKPGITAFAYAGFVNFMNFGGLTKKVGDSYSAIPLPSGITSATVGNAMVAFDQSGALWAWFEKLPAGFPPPPGAKSVGSGLYYTTDLVNWQKPANDVDSVLFASLKSIGDSVFAISSDNSGVFVFKKSAAVTIYTFTGNGNWTDAANWVNGLIPPATLPYGSEIIIDPAESGECVLNTNQTVAPGGKLTVKQPKKFRIPGNLNVQVP
jgi:hypothetical protein